MYTSCIPNSYTHAPHSSYTDIIEAVVAGGEKLRRPLPPPEELTEARGEMDELITQCWAESPEHRPSFRDIIRQLKRSNHGR